MIVEAGCSMMLVSRETSVKLTVFVETGLVTFLVSVIVLKTVDCGSVMVLEMLSVIVFETIRF